MKNNVYNNKVCFSGNSILPHNEALFLYITIIIIEWSKRFLLLGT